MNIIYALVLSIAMFFLAACGESDSPVNLDDEANYSLLSSFYAKSSSSFAKSSSSVKPLSSESAKKVSDGCVYDAKANTLKDLRDGQTYKTVKIGNQVWMAENLNCKTENSFCYNNNEKNCLKYGLLYTWSAAMDSVGVFSEYVGLQKHNGDGAQWGLEKDKALSVRCIKD